MRHIKREPLKQGFEPTIHRFYLKPWIRNDFVFIPRPFDIIERDNDFLVSINDIETFIGIKKEVLKDLILGDEDIVSRGSVEIELNKGEFATCVNQQGLPLLLAIISYRLEEELLPGLILEFNDFISEKIMSIVIKSVGSNQNDLERLSNSLFDEKAIIEALIAENKMLKFRINNLESLNQRLVEKISELQKVS